MCEPNDQLPEKELLKLYEIYRDYAKHEDYLINFRMTWFMASQAFLFGAYAIMAQEGFRQEKFHFVANVSDLVGKVHEVSVSLIIILLISFFQLFFTAMRSFSSIKAATVAVRALRSKWHADILGGRQHPKLPGLTGGGSEKAHSTGWNSATFLPGAATAIWPLIAILHGVLLR